MYALSHDTAFPRSFFEPPSPAAIDLLLEMQGLYAGGELPSDASHRFEMLVGAEPLSFVNNGWYIFVTVGSEPVFQLLMPTLASYPFPTAIFRYDTQEVYLPLSQGYVLLQRDAEDGFMVQGIHPPTEGGAAFQRIEALVYATQLSTTVTLDEDFSFFEPIQQMIGQFNAGDETLNAQYSPTAITKLQALLDEYALRKPVRRVYHYTYGAFTKAEEHLDESF